jgi:hypothetical protein
MFGARPRSPRLHDVNISELSFCVLLGQFASLSARAAHFVSFGREVAEASGRPGRGGAVAR